MTFFATSHGKSPCDGIGGTVKRLAARASLQAPVDNQFLTPIELFKWATTNINKIKFFYVTDEEIILHSTNHKLEDSSASVKKVPGIRSHHCFHPTSPSNFRMFCISSDSSDTASSDFQTFL